MAPAEGSQGSLGKGTAGSVFTAGECFNLAFLSQEQSRGFFTQMQWHLQGAASRPAPEGSPQAPSRLLRLLAFLFLLFDGSVVGFPLRSEFVRLWRNTPPSPGQSSSTDTEGCTTLTTTKPPAVQGEMDPSAAGTWARCGAQGRVAASLTERKPQPRGSTGSSALCQGLRGAAGAAQSWQSRRSRGCSLSPETGTDPALVTRSCKPIWEELAPGSRQGSLVRSSPTLVPLGLCASCQT